MERKNHIEVEIEKKSGEIVLRLFESLRHIENDETVIELELSTKFSVDDGETVTEEDIKEDNDIIDYLAMPALSESSLIIAFLSSKFLIVPIIAPPVLETEE